VAAVGTLPDLLPLTGKDQAPFDIGQEPAVALLVFLFDFAHQFKQGRDMTKALFLCGIEENI
jgi:hypothetical protein